MHVLTGLDPAARRPDDLAELPNRLALLDTTHPRGLGGWHGQGEVELTVPTGSLVLLAAAGADVRF